MNKEHNHKHGHDDHAHHHGPAWKRLHRDWRVWVAVGLMLAAMLAYVASMDESLRPGGGTPKSSAATSGH